MSRYEPWGSSIRGPWFSSWYVVSIDTGHIAQSPQSGPRWSLAFKMEPVLSVSSFRRTDAETEAPIVWPPDAKSRVIGKDPDSGKD